MKKLILFILVVSILCSLCACKTEETNEASPIPETVAPTVEPTVTPSPSPAQETTQEPETSEEPTQKPEDELEVIEGTFLYIEWGDYLHLAMKDDEGEVWSFFILKYPGVDPELLKEGQRIKIYWRNVDVFLEAPQETINLNEIVTIELPD